MNLPSQPALLTSRGVSMPDPSNQNVATWKMRFRRKYTADVAGLRTLADSIAAEAGELVTFTNTSEDGSSAGGVITGNKMEMLQAVEEVLSEIDTTIPSPSSVRSRVIIPDFSRCQAV